MVSSTTLAGIGLAAFGALVLVAGGGFYAACSSSGLGGCEPALGVLIFGGVLLLVGLLVAAASYRSYTYIPPTTNPAVPPPLVAPVVIHQTVEHDVVMVRCRYCGTLGDPRSGRCAACGAAL